MEQGDLIEVRRRKLERLRELGQDPFAIERYERTRYAQNILERYDELCMKDVRVSGRIVSMRQMGKASFVHIQDASGRIQAYFKKDELGEEYEKLDLMDLGDFVGIEGFVFKTRTEEITVHAKKLQILSKSLRPPPLGKQKGEEHWYGLQDVELKYRKRHLDLMTNPESLEVFEKRSRIIAAIREFFNSRGYLEVETPVLQEQAGGAAARPFMTHHNALDHDFKLRISLELYLKRLIIGGFEKVYELGRVFRNEGLSTRHNPEFTLLESYEAYADLDDIMSLVEELFSHVCRTLYGGTKFAYQGQEIDVTPPWRRLPLLDGIEQYAGVKHEEFDTLESAKAAGERLGLSMEQEHLVGGIIEKIHERFTQPHLIQPTFVTDFPIETSPLAKKRRDNPRLTRRFEPYIAAQETGNAFSEINDPIDQRERFIEQVKQRAAGDEEAHPMDEDFLEAMEYGMPPTGGLGIGIDRMVMLLTDQPSIRDVILFPQMKPEK